MADGSQTVPRFARPYDTSAIDEAIKKRGAAVLQQAFSPELCDRFVAEVDEYIERNPERRKYAAESILGGFQGPESVTLHGLVGRIPSAAEMVVQPDVYGAARRALANKTSNTLLTICEYMERRPGQPVQGLHRDTSAWYHLPIGEDAVAITVMGAMSDFTERNGATWVVLDSHGRDDEPSWDGAIQAVMAKGDALVFRSDLVHAGGANETADESRRLFSLGYQVGWLRQVENTTLSVPPAVAAGLPQEVQDLLGYSPEMVLGLFEGGHPRDALARVAVEAVPTPVS
ncbi:phytanoyl-CoA dioxygenase family protein [Amycolatopsis sp. A133]|uniref:phytanoyl-CoA dioxygenase family protein n=1 Tax=Amycolatopsis sp. A133 TaxID=3064472 RepID=UPI0027FBC99A|nr:phytanoyl-CoA dioxygenase family protein [Amycolatopsis sp. A133]MDQ7807629.1 phytanoyl-CoA dioxygenase family protein [Amycolatopsis sp. A133]